MRKMKLNNKGFTLIELLAVIVILAILAVVTIPTVLGNLKTARQETFNTSVNTIAEWFEKQYALDEISSGLGTVDAAYTTFINGGLTAGTAKNLTAEVITAAGGKGTNYDLNASTVTLTASGRMCVMLTASSTGDFVNIDTKTAQSSACS